MPHHFHPTNYLSVCVLIYGFELFSIFYAYFIKESITQTQTRTHNLHDATFLSHYLTISACLYIRIRIIFYLLCVFYQGIYHPDSDEDAYSPCRTPFIPLFNYQCAYLYTELNNLQYFLRILSRNMSPRLRRTRINSMPHTFHPNTYLSVCIFIYGFELSFKFYEYFIKECITQTQTNTHTLHAAPPFIPLINYQCVYLNTDSNSLLYFMRILSRNLSPRLRRTRIISMLSSFHLTNYLSVCVFIYGFE